jgi:hypothetical protein
MADWNRTTAAILSAYPFAAKACRIDAERFAQGVRSIDDGTLPEILEGRWK